MNATSPWYLTLIQTEEDMDQCFISFGHIIMKLKREDLSYKQVTAPGLVYKVWYCNKNVNTIKYVVKIDWSFEYCLLINCTTVFNTLRTGDADLRFYITTVQDG